MKQPAWGIIVVFAAQGLGLGADPPRYEDHNKLGVSTFQWLTAAGSPVAVLYAIRWPGGSIIVLLSH